MVPAIEPGVLGNVANSTVLLRPRREKSSFLADLDLLRPNRTLLELHEHRLRRCSDDFPTTAPPPLSPRRRGVQNARLCAPRSPCIDPARPRRDAVTAVSAPDTASSTWWACLDASPRWRRRGVGSHLPASAARVPHAFASSRIGSRSVDVRYDEFSDKFFCSFSQILNQLGLTSAMCGEWRLLKYVEEPEFGPDAGVNTVLIVGSLESKPEVLQDSCKWMSKEGAWELLSGVKPGGSRIGPYVYIGFPKSELSLNCIAASALASQEYPPGLTLVPMKSRTLSPFRTTNLVVVQADGGACGSKRSDFFACGDALLIDPGCCSQVHTELADLVNSLPKKLVVLVTHHHNDHIDGLSVVQRCNPDAVLLTHQNTMKRIGKGNWSSGYTAVTGGENICIGDQELQVVFAPGHTDGHMGVLHVNTNALIVGDHCVGHGSATLDSRAGGNMKDYFQTTYKFLDMSPHVLVPMHGRVNLWPKHMLCGYLRNRRAREASMLQSIENGAQTLFDIVSRTYCDVDRKLWIPASFNVRLHVEHLNSQHKLPKYFSMEKFQSSYGIHFFCRWAVAYALSRTSPAILAGSALAGGLVVAYALGRNAGNQPQDSARR